MLFRVVKCYLYAIGTFILFLFSLVQLKVNNLGYVPKTHKITQL